MIKKPKYTVGSWVYCRPWKVSEAGENVYHCQVIDIGSIGGTPYYDLQVYQNKQKSFKLFVRYEDETSKRPERLAREAIESLNDRLKSTVEYYNGTFNELKHLTRTK